MAKYYKPIKILNVIVSLSHSVVKTLVMVFTKKKKKIISINMEIFLSQLNMKKL